MEVARARAVEVLRLIGENVRSDSRVSIPDAAARAGISDKSFYRWLASPPKKIDVVQVSALADWLSATYGHENFATLWIRVADRIK